MDYLSLLNKIEVLKKEEKHLEKTLIELREEINKVTSQMIAQSILLFKEPLDYNFNAQDITNKLNGLENGIIEKRKE